MSLTKITNRVIESGTITANSLAEGISLGGGGVSNKIINGDMRIDQRNSGASVTPTSSVYMIDRWSLGITQASKASIQQSSTAPSGFSNSLVATSLSAYSVSSGDLFVIQQLIEGFNTANLGWGTANAQTVTLSFWVRSSLTGTFGGALNNGGATRSYPFTYTISAANTWEQKTITIAGDTSGTWLTTNGLGIGVRFSLGTGTTYSGSANVWANSTYYSATGSTSVVGTNGATFYITGVQLEVGSVATPFEQRPIGLELNLCYRYFYRLNNGVNNFMRFATGDVRLSTEINGIIPLPTTMRGTRTATVSSASHFAVSEANTNRTVTGFFVSETPVNSNWVFYTAAVASGLTPGRSAQLISNNTTASYIDFSAEL